MTAADRLDEIEARANAATPGPWSWAQWYDGLSLGARERVGVDATLFQRIEPVLGTGNDTEFIAAARQDVPALVNALRAVLAAADQTEREAFAQRRRGIKPSHLSRERDADRIRAAIEGALR